MQRVTPDIDTYTQMDTASSRPDGRTNGQIRAMQCSQGILTRADGSSRFMFGKTSVVCGIYGPTEVKLRDEQLDRATIEITVSPSIGLPSTKDKAIETVLRDMLETVILTVLHPRSLIHLSFQIVQDDGSCLSAAFNTAALALLDAGIALRTLFCGVTIAISETGEVVLDPTLQETEVMRSIHTFVFDTTLTGAYTIHSLGTFTDAEFAQCYQYAIMAGDSVIQFMKKATENKLLKENKLR